jgi:hypothetical protein
MTEDRHLVLLALAKNDAGTIHDVQGLVAPYRGGIATHPEMAALYASEGRLRSFIQAGKLMDDGRKKKHIDLNAKRLEF